MVDNGNGAMISDYDGIIYLLPMMKHNGSGYILNIASIFSKVSLAENSVYAATKHALAGYSEGLRQELKPTGIDVGLFLPGAIDTSAKKLANMIENNQRMLITPRWVYYLLRMKQAFA